MRTLVRSLFRIILIFILLQSILTFIYRLSDFLYLMPRMGEPVSTLQIIYLVSALLIIGVILSFCWWKTDWFVNILAGKVSNHEIVITTSNVDFISAAICIVGVWVIADSLPNLIGLIGQHIAIPPEYTLIDSETRAEEIKGWLFTISKIVIGFVLVLVTRGNQKTFERFWNKTEDNQEEPEQEVEQ